MTGLPSYKKKKRPPTPASSPTDEKVLPLVAKPLNWIGLPVDVGAVPLPPVVRVKLAQVILVLLPKWMVMLRLPKKEPRPWTVEAKSSE